MCKLTTTVASGINILLSEMGGVPGVDLSICILEPFPLYLSLSLFLSFFRQGCGEGVSLTAR